MSRCLTTYCPTFGHCLGFSTILGSDRPLQSKVRALGDAPGGMMLRFHPRT
jgi:hypothetical protein